MLLAPGSVRRAEQANKGGILECTVAHVPPSGSAGAAATGAVWVSQALELATKFNHVYYGALSQPGIYGEREKDGAVI